MKPDRYVITFLVLSIIAVILRIMLAPYGTFGVDLATFQNWSEILIRHKFSDFYTLSNSDYLPGYNYFLWFLGKLLYWLANQSILIDPRLLFKLPAIFSDLGNAFLIYLLAKKFTTNKKALLSSSVFLFNPAVLINSTFWGQIDSIITIFLLSSFYFLIRRQYLLSAVLLGFCQSIKPIPLLVIPIFIIYIWFKVRSPLKSFLFLFFFIITALVAFYPFNNQSNFLKFFMDINSMVSNRWPYATINAFNFWTITSFDKTGNLQRISDETKFLYLSWQYWGYLFFSFFYLYVLIHIKRGIASKKNLFLVLVISLSIIYLAMFTFFTRMHERHLFYALPFLTLLLPIIRRKGLLITFSIYLIYTFNVFFSMKLVSSDPIILQPWQLFLLSLPNIIALFYLSHTIKKAGTPIDR